MTATDLLIEGDNRPASYLEGDTIVLRASSFGSACIRDLVLHLLGEHDPLPTPPDLQVRFDAGHAAEPLILNRLRDLGWESNGQAQAEGELAILPGVVIRFHPDEVMDLPQFPGAPRLVECKALAPSTFDQAQRKGTGSLFSYDWQLSVMMHGLKVPAVWVGLRKNPDDPEDFTGELHMEYVDTPPRSRGELVKRAKAIKDAYLLARDGGDLPDCQDPSIYPCPFLYLRPEREEKEGVEQLVGTEQEQVEDLGRRYLRAHADEAAAKKVKDECRTALRTIAGNRLGIRGQTVRAVTVKQVRTSYDTNAMARKWGQAEVDEFKVSKEIEVFRVEEVGG